MLSLDILLLIPFLLILNPWFYSLAKRIIRSERFLKVFSLYGDQYYASQSVLNKPKVYAISMAFTLPAAFLSAMSLYLSLMAVGVPPSLPVSVFIFSSAQVFGMATALPGSIGVTDGSLVALLGSYFNLNATLSSSVTIMTRLVTLWFGVILGMIFLFYTMRYWKPTERELRTRKKKRRN